MGDSKMSKHLGNVIYADDLVNMFGVDAVRYYLLHEIPYDNDGSITWDLIVERINSDLANILGNLVNRTIAMCNQYFGGVVEDRCVAQPVDQELKDVALAMPAKMNAYMNEYKTAKALDEVFTLLRRTNKYIDDTEPWKLAKDETKRDRLATVLYNLIEAIRFSAVALEAFMPSTSKKILDMINTDERDLMKLDHFGAYRSGDKVTDHPEVLFKRLDPKKVAKQVEALNPAKKELKKEKKASKPEISIDDFDKLELVVGEVVSCEKHPDADRLLVEQINIGDETRQVVSGIAKFYTPEEMVGKKVVLVKNLKPAKLRGVESQGMILCSSTKKKLFVVDPGDLPNGSKVS
jgi:methionyl-tRNA synthetase